MLLLSIWTSAKACAQLVVLWPSSVHVTGLSVSVTDEHLVLTTACGRIAAPQNLLGQLAAMGMRQLTGLLMQQEQSSHTQRVRQGRWPCSPLRVALKAEAVPLRSTKTLIAVGGPRSCLVLPSCFACKVMQRCGRYGAARYSCGCGHHERRACHLQSQSFSCPCL